MNTISSNLPEMAKGVKMLAALMDDEGANGDDLMMAAKQVHILTLLFCEKMGPKKLDTNTLQAIELF